ncbi:hypothetical protein BU23DRAFT_596739 [Bimuria novae-zelandiae CBS 107.79]|uniref:Uncharacterized protein n=1 Tax=Bimuria novae-zelandiae CBS 107.79 TaxID=1447943 RepID=A0A6A5VJ96_9PLEO|nr:hypothetical protein BU23DRAFT_596739 [Bimuria novae-zelandiae CBS 107.79]
MRPPIPAQGKVSRKMKMAMMNTTRTVTRTTSRAKQARTSTSHRPCRRLYSAAHPSKNLCLPAPEKTPILVLNHSLTTRYSSTKAATASATKLTPSGPTTTPSSAVSPSHTYSGRSKNPPPRTPSRRKSCSSSTSSKGQPRSAKPARARRPAKGVPGHDPIAPARQKAADVASSTCSAEKMGRWRPDASSRFAPGARALSARLSAPGAAQQSVAFDTEPESNTERGRTRLRKEHPTQGARDRSPHLGRDKGLKMKISQSELQHPTLIPTLIPTVALVVASPGPSPLAVVQKTSSTEEASPDEVRGSDGEGGRDDMRKGEASRDGRKRAVLFGEGHLAIVDSADEKVLFKLAGPEKVV